MRYLTLVLVLLLGTIIAKDFLDPNALAQSAKKNVKPAYLEKYNRFVKPFYSKVGKVGKFSGKKGIEISYISFIHPTAKDSLTIAPGFGESYIKYDETIYDFYHKGFSVFVIDHRGQGFSGSLGQEKDIVHVDDFQYYVDDLKTLFQKVVLSSNHKRNFLLGHSMGGAIATRYLEQFPKDFHAAILSTPMHEINTGMVPRIIVKGLAVSRKATAAMPGSVSCDKRDHGPKNNPVTHDPARWTMNQNKYEAHPIALRCRGSNGWLRTALNATKLIHTNASKITTPILLFQAELDTYVKASAHKFVCKKAQKCMLLLFPNAKHELFHEIDSIRNPAMFYSVSFLKEGYLH